MMLLIVTSILLPKSLTSIIANGLGKLNSMTEFILPPSVKTIKDQMLYNCNSLKIFQIKANSQLQSLTRWFIGYLKVEEIRVPIKTTYIASSAFERSYSFSYCKQLRCGLNIDENNYTKLMKWVEEAMLLMKSVLQCKEKKHV